MTKSLEIIKTVIEEAVKHETSAKHVCHKFAWNFAYWKIRGYWLLEWQVFFKFQPKTPKYEIFCENSKVFKWKFEWTYFCLVELIY